MLPTRIGWIGDQEEAEAELEVPLEDAEEQVEGEDRVGGGAEEGQRVVEQHEVLVEELRRRRRLSDEDVQHDVD